MKLNEFIASVRASDGLAVEIPEKWGQGRAAFGGLVAAAMYEKMAPSVTPDRVVRSLMVSFVAPVEPGSLEIVVKVLREGKGATQVQATAYQKDLACAVMLGSFGGDRESSIEVQHEAAVEFNGPDSVSPMPFFPKLSPDFSQYFDYRFTVGKMPFMGSDDSNMGGWIRMREELSSPVCIGEMLALLDAWPPAVFSMLKKIGVGSSLTWNISFVDTRPQFSASEWWQYLADIKQSSGGYSHIDSTMWAPDGQVAMLSRQTVSVFA